MMTEVYIASETLCSLFETRRWEMYNICHTHVTNLFSNFTAFENLRNTLHIFLHQEVLHWFQQQLLSHICIRIHDERV